jgi:hypothetical protein
MGLSGDREIDAAARGQRINPVARGAAGPYGTGRVRLSTECLRKRAVNVFWMVFQGVWSVAVAHRARQRRPGSEPVV